MLRARGRCARLRSYINRFHRAEALRFSLANYREQEDMTNVPLYAIGSRIRERATGLEPATSSLEGWRSTN